MAFKAFLLNNTSLILMVIAVHVLFGCNNRVTGFGKLGKALLRSKVKGENPVHTCLTFMEAVVKEFRIG